MVAGEVRRGFFRNSFSIFSDVWIWDLTVPDGGDHDFYIRTTAAPVLVHNCEADDWPQPGDPYDVNWDGGAAAMAY
jgi:hypothetical protein